MTGALIIVFLVLEPNGQRGLGRLVNKVEGVAFSILKAHTPLHVLLRQPAGPDPSFP
jgi:hypothetical protein